MSVKTAHYADPELLDALESVAVTVPRGEPRRNLAELAKAVAAREPEAEIREKLAIVAEGLWTDEVRTRAEEALRESAPLFSEQGENPAALALAYRAALPLVARDERVQAPLKELEPSLALLDEEDRARFAPILARAATPALGLDVALMKDEGYYFVSVFPPEGSEGVDIVGKAAKWLTKRMTMDGEAPRVAMRRFLAILAEEVEIDLPVVAATIDRALAEPVPPAPASDRLFVGLARGLVEEIVAERGFPF